MKISLYSRPCSSISGDQLRGLMSAFEANSMEVQVNSGFADCIRDITGQELPAERIYRSAEEISGRVMVSYGGDGTFLDAVRALDGRSVPVVGINSGRLGFLANIAQENMSEALKDIAAGEYDVKASTLLECRSEALPEEDLRLAFNEVTIQRRGANMIAVDICVDGETVASCHGDGVLLSTPAGSTAYSLSVGGPIVASDCNCFVVSPIAPHNLTMRPIVIPDRSEVRFRVRTRGDRFDISLDNRNYTASDGTLLEVRKSEKSVFLVRLRNISFYDTLRNKMMWGVDGRDGIG